MGANSALLSGLALFVMAGSAGVAVFLLQKQAARDAMRIGAASLAAGMLIVITALALHAPLLFFVGLVAAGTGFGTGFRGAVRSVVSHAHANERAGVLAVIFVIAYLAMGLPAMGAGYLLSQGNELQVVAREFGTAIVLLALLPLLIPTKVAKVINNAQAIHNPR